jgi:TonB family protein
VRPAPAQRTIEVAYEGSVGVLEAPVPPQDVVQLPARMPKENPLEKNALAITEFIKKDILKIVDRQPEERPFTDRERVNKSVSMPPIPGETFKTPEYRSYYSLVREKIRKYAYFYYRRLEEGEVYLSFSLKPEGALANLVIDESQSTESAYLKDIARQSVNEAAPYPPFPQKLKDNAELSFDVIIEFRLK